MPKEEPKDENLVKCPGCSVELPEDDLRAHVAHMEQFHPDIIEQRLREAKPW